MRRIVTAVGNIDGSNTTFTLPGTFTYQSGSVFIIVNGITIPASHDNGAIEVNNTTIQTKETLLTGDVLLISFDDGLVSDIGLDISITGDVTDYKIDYNVSRWSVSYNTNIFRIG